MKNQEILRKMLWVLAIGFVSAMAFSACKSTGADPKQAEHPEHPMTTNAPPQKP